MHILTLVSFENLALATTDMQKEIVLSDLRLTLLTDHDDDHTELYDGSKIPDLLSEEIIHNFLEAPYSGIKDLVKVKFRPEKKIINSHYFIEAWADGTTLFSARRTRTLTGPRFTLLGKDEEDFVFRSRAIDEDVKELIFTSDFFKMVITNLPESHRLFSGNIRGVNLTSTMYKKNDDGCFVSADLDLSGAKSPSNMVIQVGTEAGVPRKVVLSITEMREGLFHISYEPGLFTFREVMIVLLAINEL